MKAFPIFMTLVVSILTACGSIHEQKASTAKDREERPQVEQTLPVETPTPKAKGTNNSPKDPQVQGIVIIFQLSGGFAGLDKEWIIFNDGRVLSNNGTEWQSTPEQVSQLLTEIENLGFFELEQNQLPRDTCCDRFIYMLTVMFEDRTQTLTTIDGDDNTPQALWGAIEKVRVFLDQLI